MHNEKFLNPILKSTYTWDDNYVLPYESIWSIKVKFCFLNGESWSWFAKKKPLNNYKRSESFTVSYDSFDDSNASDLRIVMTDTIVRICPVCIKYGYHTMMHQSMYLRHCPLHPDIELISIEKDILNQSKDGIYGFSDVKIENLIRNELICRKILNYLESRVKTLKMWIFTAANSNTNCLESTSNAVERYYYQITNENEYNNKKILDVSIDEILNLNSCIYEEMIVSLANDELVRNVHSMLDECIECQRLSIEMPSEKHLFKFNGLSSAFYMKSFVGNIIRIYFTDLNEFKRFGEMMNNSFALLDKRCESEISKIAIYMTIARMINCSDASEYYRLNGVWCIFGQPCGFATSLISNISGYVFANYLNDVYLENGLLFIIQAIFKDYFEYVKGIFTHLMSTGEIDYRNIALNTISKDIISDPEYVVIRYSDSWSVIACYPDRMECT